MECSGFFSNCFREAQELRTMDFKQFNIFTNETMQIRATGLKFDSVMSGQYNKNG